MAGNRQSEAYDLSLFEERPAKVVALKPNKKLIQARKRQEKMQMVLNTVVTLCIAALAVAVLGTMIASRVRLTEMESAITEREQQLVILKSENTRLTDDLARKMSAKSVEEYAVSVLGMQKADTNQIAYVTVESGDKAEVAQEEEGSFWASIAGAIGDFFTQLAYLSD